MDFSVLIPARLASTRLPDKPLADIAGLPMVVRVARQAQQSGAARVVVATDSPRIAEACARHQVDAVMTAADHPSGSDRLAEACAMLDLPAEACVVNVQGDEPLIDPALIRDVAVLLIAQTQAPMCTAAHPITDASDFANPNVVKVVLDAHRHALYFSRAPIPWPRDHSPAGQPALPASQALRHVGIYAYRAGFLRAFPQLPRSPIEDIEALEQLRVLWNGHRIAVHLTPHAPAPGVDTPQDLERVRHLLSRSA
ncbi:MAG: 3-deoxy-manno-octulosonate cytidylyltransferase [Betaproteobacteria bacterium]|nr:3-deoxy-manno-octulosonate cytidylyltransferase [Betaproteobacteria bacterium]